MEEAKQSNPPTPQEEELVESYARDYVERTKETGRFSERVEILPDGHLNWADEQGNATKAFMVDLAYPEGTEGLYQLASQVQSKFPELSFSFERDSEGKWIEYTVVNAKIVPPKPK